MGLRSPVVNHDILHCIALYLNPGWDVDPDPYEDPSVPVCHRQALVRLAMAHSTFARPAMSVLWRSLPSDRALKGVLSVVGIAKQLPLEEHSTEPEWVRVFIPPINCRTDILTDRDSVKELGFLKQAGSGFENMHLSCEESLSTCSLGSATWNFDRRLRHCGGIRSGIGYQLSSVTHRSFHASKL